MKQLIQSYRTGVLGLYDVPSPICQDNGILMQTSASLVSAGTEKMIIDLAKKSLVGKAQSRPDLVKQVINKMKQEGVKNTLEKVFTKLDSPIPLGYSCCGKVIKIGKYVNNISIGDRIACGGAGYANHSEINYIPKNLYVKVPSNVSDIEASFVTVGAIALQGVRQASPCIGESVCVIGLGLIGQLTIQLLKANGCSVIGSDTDIERCKLAKTLGADIVCKPNELLSKVSEYTNSLGVDQVIITASTTSNQPIVMAAEISRQKGKVIIVGMISMDIPRNDYYKKELDIKFSMAYGPGRYDINYEEKGTDYPYHYVRWTEQRNFGAFLKLISQKKIVPAKLISHQFDFVDALEAYQLLEGKKQESYLGIILNYKNVIETNNKVIINEEKDFNHKIKVGMIGAGNFARSVILPNLNKIKDIDLLSLCTQSGISSYNTGKKYSFKSITNNSRDIFESSEINSLIVTTRHHDHAENILKAIQAKKHIFIEKPLCINETELNQIKTEYDKLKEKIIIQVGFNRRFSSLIRKMKDLIKDNRVAINYRINAGIIPLDSWIQDRQIGGGRIIGEVCHFIDTCSYLIGSQSVSVYSSCIEHDDNSIPNEDNISINLKYENGSIAQITYYAFGNNQMPKEYLEVFFRNVSMQMDNFRKLTVFWGNKKIKVKNSNQDKGFKKEFEKFFHSIKTNDPCIPFESIYKTTMATFMIFRSLKENKEIKI